MNRACPKIMANRPTKGHESNDLSEARGFINKFKSCGQGFFYI